METDWGEGHARFEPEGGPILNSKFLILNSVGEFRMKNYELRIALAPHVFGNVTVNVDPSPGVLSTDTAPPCISTNLFTSASPSPVPLEFGPRV